MTNLASAKLSVTVSLCIVKMFDLSKEIFRDGIVDVGGFLGVQFLVEYRMSVPKKKRQRDLTSLGIQKP